MGPATRKDEEGKLSTTPTITPVHHRRRGLTAPVLLITLGAIFLAAEFFPDWGVRKTWPVLLLVWGIAKLIDASLPPRPPEGPRV